ncbi:PDZ domain (Also known as DHR or GLGF) [Thalassoglobus neptunius]|uniref:PDZ domain (Also known as DHR or GLGF) n=1 Tax=Thalassoglobus neptunius TaxID=1938619 RepID=A0A5C5X0Y3_9PLAN|nr:PDZ domain-containing protein [Thalassoglobus neptunius]TWT56804.1 PDZ domain (Also known as DHR or GLGF) [Thalassoglobus neptunius]
MNWKVVAFATIAFALNMDAQDAPAGEVVSERADIETAIQQLSSDSFPVRENARRQLASVSENQIPLLGQVARDADSEQAGRIVDILEVIFLADDGTRGELAERMLEDIRNQGGVASIDAGEVLRANARLRESRARQAIEKLGGEFVYYAPDANIQGLWLFESSVAVLPGIGVGFGPPSVLKSVYLHEDWTGTKEDLWHLQRLSNHRDLTVYLIEGASVSVNDLFVLAASLPGLSIQERGACLGIQGDNTGGLCAVGEVVEGSAAADAGLQPNDLIIGLNKTPIRNFPHLVEELKAFDVGDQVVFAVIRGRDRLVIPVTLGSWRSVSQRSQYVASPPEPFGGPLASPEQIVEEAPSTTRPPSPELPSKTPIEGDEEPVPTPDENEPGENKKDDSAEGATEPSGVESEEGSNEEE